MKQNTKKKKLFWEEKYENSMKIDRVRHSFWPECEFESERLVEALNAMHILYAQLPICRM